MRNRQEYQQHGRNDPLDDTQRQEHPYDFVALPNRAAQGEATGHDRYHEPAQRLTGHLVLTYETLEPLHVGSGTLETASDCQLDGGAMPVRGMIRSHGRPVLPGSSWKGAVRARFEAITRSRLALKPRLPMVPESKIPRPLRDPQGRPGGKYKITLCDPVVDQLSPLAVKRHRESDEEVRKKIRELSPAEALFGAMGYRGRLSPGDGRIEGPSAGEPLEVPPLEGPQPHRLAKPGASYNSGGKRLTIRAVEGRKFYYDGPVLHTRVAGGGPGPACEHIDSVPAGSSITLEVRVDSVTEPELGALLVSAGWGQGTGVLRFGGYKAAGLGKVALRRVEGQLFRGSQTRRWHRQAGETPQPEVWVDSARQDGLIDPKALQELHEVTTRRRP